MTYEEFNGEWLPLKDALFRIAFYMLGNQADAEDTVQDLYAKLWSTRDTLDYVYNPKAYCTTLIKRMCIDRIRKLKEAPINPVQEIEGESIEKGLISKEKLKRVQDLIERLPKREREVLKLKVIDELSYEQIAKQTGINYLTLRVLISNARRKLKAVSL